MADNKAKAQQLKTEGNEALSADKPEVAIDKYTQAIALDPDNHVLYSNRSAAHAKLQNYKKALEDAEMTIKVKSDWSKGYSRKGAALVYLNRLSEAEEAYNEGLKIDPNNEQLKSGLEECKAKSRRSGPSMTGLSFDDPKNIAKLVSDPRTRSFMSDPTYMKMLREISEDNSKLNAYIQDERIASTLSVILGLDLKSGRDDDMETSSPDTPPATRRESPKVEKKEKKEDKMEVDLTPTQQEALEEKNKGNAAYKSKNFDEAIKHYEKAVELDPTNITFLTNMAAVKFEQKNYDECVSICEKAVEVGRENRADFKLIAKALTRIGNSYKQKEDFAKAKAYYEKALSEHRTPETKDLLMKVEKKMKEQERLAYIDVEKAEEEKEKGNEYFKKGDFPTAIKHYTEASLRNPNDAKIFSNRAACYAKLAEFNLGLKDCDECIRLDPKFIKGYIRKAKFQQGLKQFSKAQDSFQKALELDPNHPEALEGVRECIRVTSQDPDEVRQRAMSDPEVQNILKDPAMRIILDQMQNDPRALQDHLKNPHISAKIQKLIQSGMISIR